jgi:hypothetical protein
MIGQLSKDVSSELRKGTTISRRHLWSHSLKKRNPNFLHVSNLAKPAPQRKAELPPSPESSKKRTKKRTKQ